MKLLIQPESGDATLVAAIKRARKTIDIAIFRFDLAEVEKALTAAASGKVRVRALIAHTNKGGDKRLRKLELRLLEAGVTVARTADDLVRYHGKYVIIDRAALWVLGFNATHLDVFRSRSFGLVTTDKGMVREALALFESDSNREPFRPKAPDMVVSPENARNRLAALIKAARKQLLIYDPKISDGPMLRLLAERAKAGVDVRVLGKVTMRGKGLRAAKPALRLHVRAIVRDGREAFVGSQSLRGLELDRRREVGVIVRNQKIARQIQTVFEADWDQVDADKKDKKDAKEDEKAAKDDKAEATG
jgi:cardiolipin synthase